MIEAWSNGAWIVNTSRTYPPRTNLLKKLLSKAFYKAFDVISDVKLSQANSDLRLIDRKVAVFLNSLEQRTKFYRGLVAWSGFPHVTIEYTASERVRGKSGYSLVKMFELARVGITFFSYLPLKLIVVFGLLLSGCSTFLFLITLISKFLYPDLFSSAALFGSFILANSGVIIVILGVIALYQVNLYREVQGLPSYVVLESKNFPD